MNTPTTNSPLTWELPSKKAIRDAITYFVQRPKNAPYLTLQFKLHNPSAYKKRVLLEAHVAITNMLAELVAHFYEDPEHPRLNGIVATLFNAKKARSDGKVSASSLLALIHSTVKAFNIKPSIALTSPIIDGIYRDCAEMFTSWFSLLSQQPAFTELTITTLEEFYQAWHRAVLRYHYAMSTIVSLSLSLEELEREPEYRLKRRSKREAYWLLERLLDEDTLVEVSEYIKAILDDESSSLKSEALSVEHAWHTSKKRRRSTREQWFFVRHVQPDQTRHLLGNFHQDELEQLQQEIAELFTYFEHANSIIDKIYPADLRVTLFKDLDTPQDKLRFILHDFLYHKPHSFPKIDPVRFHYDTATHYTIQRIVDDVTQAIVHDQNYENRYEQSMNWFQLYTGDGDVLKRFLSTEQEAKIVQHMFHTLRMLKPPKLYGIRFKGTTRPTHYTDAKYHAGQWRYFTLLYDQQTFALTLAVVIHPAKTTLLPSEEQAKPRMRQRSEYAQRRAMNPLYYVNFPTTPFQPPSTQPYLLFNLECGEVIRWK